MARPRSDIGKLQYRDIDFEFQDKQPISVMIHFREAKETQIKTTVIRLMDNQDTCVVTTLYQFIEATKNLRRGLPEHHKLFLAYINDTSKISSVQPGTVATWVSTIIKKAGIDTTIYKPHSIRSASSTKAVELGMEITKVKQHANWSQKSDTSQKYYYKPIAQRNDSTVIANSIFPHENNLPHWSPSRRL